MQIEGKRVRSFESVNKMSIFWRQFCESTKSGISVNSEIFFCGNISDFIQRIDGSGIDGAGIRDNAGRQFSLFTIMLYCHTRGNWLEELDKRKEKPSFCH